MRREHFFFIFFEFFSLNPPFGLLFSSRVRRLSCSFFFSRDTKTTHKKSDRKKRMMMREEDDEERNGALDPLLREEGKDHQGEEEEKGEIDDCEA